MINVNLLYPVGSIYISVNGKNPSEIFGGTWEQITGRFLIGVDPSNTNFNESGKTGGSETHYHQYGVEYNAFYAAICASDIRLIKLYNGQTDSFVNSSVTGKSSEQRNNGIEEKRGSTIESTKMQTKTNTTSASSYPPYFTCYIWYRTA